MEEGSIAKAAEKMLTASSNVSLQIATLEEELGLELFKREKKRLIPTDDAWRIYNASKQHLTAIDDIYINTAKIIKETNGKLIRIAAHSYALSHLLPESLAELIKQHKGCELKLHNVSRETGLEMLKRGEVDLICFPLDTNDDDLIIEDIYYCKAVLAMNKNHPLTKIPDEDLTWEEIRKHEVGYIGKNVTIQGLIGNIKRWKLKGVVDFREGGTWEIGKGLISNNLCIGFFEANYLNESDKKYIAQKNIAHLLPDYSFQIALRNKRNKDIVVQFIDSLKKLLKPS